MFRRLALALFLGVQGVLGDVVSFSPTQLQNVREFLEALGTKPVILDVRALDVAVNLQTSRPLSGAETVDFVKRSLRASGLVWLEDTKFITVCRAEDRDDVLSSTVEVNGLPFQAVKVIEVKFADVSDIMDVVQDAFRAVRPVDTGREASERAATTENNQTPQLPPPPVQVTPQGQTPQGQAPASQVALGSGEAPLPESPIKVRVVRVDDACVTGDIVNRRIVLRGSQDWVLKVSDWISQLDVAPQQVTLKVLVASYDKSRETDWGTDVWALANSAGAQTFRAGSATFGGMPTVDVSALTTASAFPTATAAQGVLAIYGQSKNLAGVFNAVETNARFKVLQRPMLSTLNHKSASIYVGSQVPVAGQNLTQAGVSTGQAASLSTSTSYVSVRLQIDCVPHIQADGQLKLEFRQTNNDVTGYATIGTNSVPIIGEQGLRNTFLVPDGGMVAFGGLTTDTESKQVSGVPVLGRIPVLGALFGKTTKHTETKELVVFVEPHIAALLPAVVPTARPAGTHSIPKALPVDPKNGRRDLSRRF